MGGGQIKAGFAMSPICHCLLSLMQSELKGKKCKKAEKSRKTWITIQNFEKSPFCPDGRQEKGKKKNY